MSHAAWVLFAWAAAACGFAALALAMDRHYEDTFGRGKEPGAARRWLRAGGSAGLLLSLLASLAAQGPTQGWVLWLGVLTAAALAVVLTLSYGPRRSS